MVKGIAIAWRIGSVVQILASALLVFAAMSPETYIHRSAILGAAVVFYISSIIIAACGNDLISELEKITEKRWREL